MKRIVFVAFCGMLGAVMAVCMVRYAVAPYGDMPPNSEEMTRHAEIGFGLVFAFLAGLGGLGLAIWLKEQGESK